MNWVYQPLPAADQNAAAGTDALTASDIATDAPVIDSPTLQASAQQTRRHATLPDPYPGDADEASIAYWREQQRKQNEAIQKLMRDALEGADGEAGAEDGEDDAPVIEEVFAITPLVLPDPDDPGALLRFAEMLEDEDEIELLLMALA